MRGKAFSVEKISNELKKYMNMRGFTNEQEF